MKKILFSMLGAGLILTSCSSDEPFATGEGGEKQVTFTLNVPDAVGTRANGAAGSDKGGVSNNPNATIYYTLELYYNGVKEGESMTVTSTEKQVTFNPTVILGRNYNVVAYANLVGEEKDLNDITVSTGINDETNDAYFANVPTKFTESDLSEDITLKRPFGKLRLVATDYDAEKTAITDIKVTYAAAHQNKFNALTSVGTDKFGVFATDVDTFNGVYTATHEPSYYNDATGEKTIFVDYIAAPAEGETSVKFDIEVTYAKGAESFTRTFAQDIPVKRNALTTLKGNFFTANAAITVTVDENFDSENATEIEFNTVTSNEELKEALSQNEEHIYIKLADDLTVDVSSWQTLAFGGENTKTITIDGAATRSENNTLTFNLKDSDWSHVTTNNNAHLTIKNATIASTGYNTDHWKRYAVHFACPLALENVVSQPIGFKQDTELKNVTINTVGDNYSLWIWANGQTVSADGLVVKSEGRAFKIGDEDAEGGLVTLNVKNARFATENKAAVLVTSVDGAVINWGEGNDISEVAADNINAVWVDEDRAAYANKVTVNGASKVVEGKYVVVADNTAFANAVKDATEGTTVKLLSGEYDLTTIPDGVTIEGSGEETVIDFANKTVSGFDNVTFKNLKITEDTGNYNGIQGASKVTYDNCVIEGVLWVYSTDTYFNTCTFTNTANVYNAWIYGGGKAEFINCKFNNEYNRGLLIYNEGAKVYDVKLSGCEFGAKQIGSNKAAIQMHTEKGISGSLTIDKTTATGYNDQSGTGQLWSEVNNGGTTEVKTKEFTVTVDGKVVQTAE